ncbi:MAG: 30S ribosome-binding factor RbfA [Blastochloris sp.]|nr:30S ribosome-binding factor RbfA [Blastochloris sp.]
MSSRRTIRVSGVIQAEISRLISRERLLEGTVITVTAVDVTPDLRQAFIYISFLESDQPAVRVMEILAKQSFHFQKEIAARTHLKNTPKLSFRHDQNIERGDRVLELLKEVEQADQNRPTPPAPDIAVRPLYQEGQKGPKGAASGCVFFSSLKTDD